MDRPAELESLSIHITPDSRYPVRNAIEMTYAIPASSRATDRPLHSPELRILAGAARLRRALTPWRKRRPHSSRRLLIQADLVTPLCQHTRVRHLGGSGELGFDLITSINPSALGPGTHQFVYAAFFRSDEGNAAVRQLKRSYLHRVVRQHLGVEDHALFAEASVLEADRIRRTPFDATVDAVRAMFTRYVTEKSHLYPRNSLLHTTAYPPSASKAAAGGGDAGDADAGDAAAGWEGAEADQCDWLSRQVKLVRGVMPSGSAW